MDPAAAVAQQKVKKDGDQQHGDQRGADAIHRRAQMGQQIAADPSHTINEFGPDRFFVDGQTGGQRVHHAISGRDGQGRPAAFFERPLAERTIGERQLFCQGECGDAGESAEHGNRSQRSNQRRLCHAVGLAAEPLIERVHDNGDD